MRVGEEVEIESEESRQAHAQRLHRPARIGLRAPQQLLHQHQPGDGEAEPGADAQSYA